MTTWTNNFTTLFNKLYLAKGLALCQSLESVCEDYRLFLFAFDVETERAVQQMGFEHVTVISLLQLEEYCPDLLKDKSKKTTAEYCWTCKGPSMQYCLDKYELDSICYMDSDLFFFDAPRLLLEESSSADVILTLHDYYDKLEYLGEESGSHCAQFIAFKNNENGRKILDWWTGLCLEWCYANTEGGLFGDQKYLDTFADHWEGVHDIKQCGCCGPWNIQRYDIVKEEGKLILVENGVKKPLVFYHFHYLRNKKYAHFEIMELGPIRYSNTICRIIYRPYIKVLMETEKRIREWFPSMDALGSECPEVSTFSQRLYLLKSCLKKNFLIWKRK